MTIDNSLWLCLVFGVCLVAYCGLWMATVTSIPKDTLNPIELEEKDE